TLRDRLTESSLSVYEALIYALQIARGMRFAWRTNHTIHLDLKPENLLITRDGILKISDFGLSRELGLGGTPPYSAPEIDQNTIATPAADVYSFGVITWEMIAGSAISPRGRHLISRKLKKYRLRAFLTLIDECISRDAGSRPSNFDVVCE